MAHPDDTFTLYDLRVEVVAGSKPMVCNHAVGDYFELSGENLSLPPGQTLSDLSVGRTAAAASREAAQDTAMPTTG